MLTEAAGAALLLRNSQRPRASARACAFWQRRLPARVLAYYRARAIGRS
jgi:hypothetical protein